MDEKFPLFLRPAVKDYLWGGERLKKEYGKSYVQISPLAECWECSTHPDGVSTIDGGEFDGMGLDEVIRRHPEYLGTKFEGLKELPILVKLIDAKDKLSVQVHPDDEYAFLNENGSRGKSELWYILEANENSNIIYGLNENVGIDLLKKGVIDGSIEKYLNKIKTRKNDVFFIKPGIVHAIGAGNVIAEIQESSNITYRLYDYNRKDKNGNKRKLHIDKAQAVIDVETAAIRQPMRVIKYKDGSAQELLNRCSYFEVSRLLINTEYIVNQRCSKESSEILLCINGRLRICNRFLEKGQCVFVPAGSRYEMMGKAELLVVRG